MNTRTLFKVNRFGKIGRIAIAVLLIAAIVATLCSCVAAIYVARLPKDAVRVSVTNQAEIKIRGDRFSTVWSMLTKGASYATDEDPTATLKDEGDRQLLPPEDMEMGVKLTLFNQSYTSAMIHSEENGKIIEAKSDSAQYRSSDLTMLLIFGTLFIASVAVTLWRLEKLFKVLSVCESPFCMDFVSRLRTFGYSLLPVAVLASVGETLAVRFLSTGQSTGILVQWGVLLAFAVTMCLVVVFRYGVQLQKESDETL